MRNHVEVLRKVIERPGDIEIAYNDHLQQIPGSRPPPPENLNLGLGPRVYRDPSRRWTIWGPRNLPLLSRECGCARGGGWF